MKWPPENVIRSNDLDRIVPYFIIAYATWTVYVHAITAMHANFNTLMHGLPLVLVLALALIYVWEKPSIHAGTGQIEPTGLTSNFARHHPLTISSVAVIWVLILGVTGTYTLFWWGSVIALGGAWLLTLKADPISLSPAPLTTRSLLVIVVIGATAICMTLISNRPDADDSFYLSIPATLLRSPDNPVLLNDTIYRLANLPIQLPVYRIHSYEVLIGVIARIATAQPVTIAYLILPSFFALFSIIAWTQLLRLLAPARYVFTLAVLFFCVLMLGEVHHSYGNFAFVRMFQGKAILATAMVPCIVYLALEYSRQGTLRHWLLLFAAQIATIGITSSGLFVVPAAAGFALVSTWSPSKTSTRRLVLGVLASSYVFLAAGVLAVITHGGEGFVTSTTMPPFMRLLDQAMGPSSALLLLTTLISSWAFAEGRSQSRVLLTISLCFFLSVLNPYTYQFVADHLTGPSTYWRLFWALPLPFMLAIFLVGVTKNLLQIRPTVFALGATGALGAGLLLFFSHTSTLRKSNYVSIGVPSLKVPALDYAVAKELAAVVPEDGTVIAPEQIATWLPTFVVHPKLLATRIMYLQAAFGPDEAKRRIALMQYLGGESRSVTAPSELRSALTDYKLTAVVIYQGAPWNAEITQVLSQSGWHCINQHVPYEIWEKAGHLVNY